MLPAMSYICYLQLSSQPVAVMQYTFTHKQYTERHKGTIHRKTQQFGRVRLVPFLCGFYCGICLTTEEEAHGKTSDKGAEVCQLAQ